MNRKDKIRIINTWTHGFRKHTNPDGTTSYIVGGVLGGDIIFPKITKPFEDPDMALDDAYRIVHDSILNHFNFVGY